MKNIKLLNSITASLAFVSMLAAPKTGHAVTTAQATTIMSTATGLIGTPYLLGGKDPTKGGIDCSGLTKWSYKKAGITIPDGAANQYAACNMCVLTKTKAALLFFATDASKPGAVTHVTLNSGDGINSVGANSSGVVKFNFTTSYWAPKLIACEMSSRW